MISIIHPSRGRPVKSKQTIEKFINGMSRRWSFEVIVSLDYDDIYLNAYCNLYGVSDFDGENDNLKEHINGTLKVIRSKNRSCVDAINNAAKIANGGLFIVVSDDTGCGLDWDIGLWNAVNDQSDYLLKTDDGIQDYIVTMTVMDRKYYERDGYIYHPDFFHQFSDTYMTCVADIRGRLITSKLKFPHLHPNYSGGKEMTDALNTRNDLSWKDGQDTFVRLMKQFSPEERNRITNRSMRGFMKHVGL